MSRRRLRPDELALWRQVAGTAEPLHRRRDPPQVPPATPRPAKVNGVAPAPAPAVLPADFGIGGKSAAARPRHDTLPGIAERIAAAPVRMDQKAHARLRRGKLRPEARIDLHGMTLDEARPALTGFILNARARRCRLVLVITGKGRGAEDSGPIPIRPGALRRQVPLWLAAPPLAQAVLQVTQAHLRHGGEGAWYVYLRRRR